MFFNIITEMLAVLIDFLSPFLGISFLELFYSLNLNTLIGILESLLKKNYGQIHEMDNMLFANFTEAIFNNYQVVSNQKRLIL